MKLKFQFKRMSIQYVYGRFQHFHSWNVAVHWIIIESNIQFDTWTVWSLKECYVSEIPKRDRYHFHLLCYLKLVYRLLRFYNEWNVTNGWVIDEQSSNWHDIVFRLFLFHLFIVVHCFLHQERACWRLTFISSFSEFPNKDWNDRNHHYDH